MKPALNRRLSNGKHKQNSWVNKKLIRWEKYD